MNTVLEKFFEAPELPSPAKNEETGDNEDEEEDKDEEEKVGDDKENEKKVENSDTPVSMGIDDFRPPYEGDDDPEDDI